jgi:hypothetical protein
MPVTWILAFLIINANGLHSIDRVTDITYRTFDECRAKVKKNPTYDKVHQSGGMQVVPFCLRQP